MRRRYSDYYGRARPRETPLWLVLLLLLLVLLGLAYMAIGMAAYLQTGGDIVGQVRTQTQAVLALTTTAEPTIADLNFVFATRTAMPPCQEFYVTVVRARVRECPSEDCETIERPYQNNLICVWGVDAKASEWYQVNLDPDEPLPRIGYMHESVIYPRRPTPRPSPTPRRSPTPLPTQTPIIKLVTTTPVPK
jgi:hypothetical protein